MKKAALSLLVFIMALSVSRGQIWRNQRIELNAGIGTTQLFGDIGGYTHEENVLGFKDIQLRQTRFNISAGATYRLFKDVSTRLNISYGLFNANDARGSNVARGFRSTTSFLEALLLGEYYIVRNSAEDNYLFSRGRSIRNRPRNLTNPRSGTFIFTNKLDIYIFTGFGVTGYSVKGNEALTAYGYHDGGITAVIPAGFGVKYLYSPGFSIGLEMGGRYAFSDLLEGYTSQYSRYNDMYYFFNATVTYKLDTTPRAILNNR